MIQCGDGQPGKWHKSQTEPTCARTEYRRCSLIMQRMYFGMNMERGGALRFYGSVHCPKYVPSAELLALGESEKDTCITDS